MKLVAQIVICEPRVWTLLSTSVVKFDSDIGI